MNNIGFLLNEACMYVGQKKAQDKNNLAVIHLLLSVCRAVGERRRVKKETVLLVDRINKIT